MQRRGIFLRSHFLSLIRVSQDLRVFAGVGLHRVKNADVLMLVHAQDEGLWQVALVIVDFEPVTLRLFRRVPRRG